MTKPHGANKDNLDKTYQLFLDLARDEFIEHGYVEASTNRIVKASGMARGSLYYHFKDKRDVYRAVYTMMMEAMAYDLQVAYSSQAQPDLAFLALAKKYFEIRAHPTRGRMLMVEPLVVLGADDCHDITTKTIRPILTDSIAKIMAQGGFPGHNKAMLAMFLFSSLTESGRIISTLPNREMAEKQFFETFEWVLGRLL